MIDTDWLSNLKKFDRERFDSLKHLNSENRNELAAIYSFNLELANIAWNVSEPELGYLKLRWWEDYINDMNDRNSFGENEYFPILSSIVPRYFCIQCSKRSSGKPISALSLKTI